MILYYSWSSIFDFLWYTKFISIFFIISHDFSDFYFYFIPAAAPLVAIPDRIQKAKSVGTDKSKKNNTVKSILGNVQSNVQTPLYLRKGEDRKSVV